MKEIRLFANNDSMITFDNARMITASYYIANNQKLNIVVYNTKLPIKKNCFEFRLSYRKE